MSRTSSLHQIGDRLTLPVLLVAAWWLGGQVLPPYVLPGPLKVLEAATRLAESGFLASDLSATLLRVLIGFVLTLGIGVPLGMLLAIGGRLGALLDPILPLMTSVSSAIWVIFAVIWFGLGNIATIFVVLMTTLPLVVTGVRDGMRGINHDLVQMAESLSFRGPAIWIKVYLPSLLPSLFAGGRLAFGFGWRVSLVAETLGASSGVGYRMRQASDLIQTDQVFAWALTVMALMLSIESFLLRPAERWLFRWRKPVGNQ